MTYLQIILSSLVLFLLTAENAQGYVTVFKQTGDVNIVLVLNNCRNSTETKPPQLQSLVNSAIWITQRINFLEILSPLRLGISVYEKCTDIDYMNIIFDAYSRNEASEFLLGVISDEVPSEKISRFCDLLNVKLKITRQHSEYLVRASVAFLDALNWRENVTILAPRREVLESFYQHSMKRFVCIGECHVYSEKCPVILNNTDPFVFFGNEEQIAEFIRSQAYDEQFGNYINAVFVPLDGSLPTGLPENSYVLLPPHSPPTPIYTKSVNILPTPLLFEVGKPLLNYVLNTADFIKEKCNETIYKINCLRNKFNNSYTPRFLSSEAILDLLKIEPLKHHFVYNIFKYENYTTEMKVGNMSTYLEPFTKLLTYNIFDENITTFDPNFEISFNDSVEKAHKCPAYFTITDHNDRLVTTQGFLIFRSESWVFAFLSLSLLGVIFCVAILVFLLTSICRRDILEGNPVLTLWLLVTVMLMFCSVLPFSIEANDSTKETLCLIKALAVTFSYAAVFSLILARCILLATASKEIGFMSHIAGPVQSFLTLFIFGVQASLGLQVIGRCSKIFEGYSFLFLMSYNAMLLILLLCLTPMIYPCQRNYREGKYFTIATVLIFCVWCVWVPCYAVLGNYWKEPLLCFGLVSTAGIIIGAIFIPRTYLMTIASARDKITSALPSLGTATSAVDIYRVNTQPIYDCVNVAAINAVAVARAGVAPTATNIQQPDLYSCPTLPDDEDFDFRCDTPPISDDKVTRF